MAREIPSSAKRPSEWKPPQPLTVPITVGGHTFKFHLFARPLQLGPKLTVQYYWMDASGLRSLDCESAEENFRSCVGLWSQAMRGDGCMEEPDQLRLYVTAMCYPLVCRNKSTQAVYRDAILDPIESERTDVSVPDGTRERITKIVKARDRDGVGAELDAALNRFEPIESLMPELSKTYDDWIQKGVGALIKDGRSGSAMQENFLRFLREIDQWIGRNRKKGGRGSRRTFLNMLAYEAKAAFYLCYANAWIDLIRWLKENRGLDVVSERFLRFWHNQVQPAELPDGTVQKDVFKGQVLALHPLSGVFMRDAGLCAVAGKFFAGDQFDRVMRSGDAGDSPDYWNLTGAILHAAHGYRLADQQIAGKRSGGRKATVQADDDREAGSTRPANYTERLVLEDFSEYGKVRCPECGGAFKLVRFHPAAADGESFNVDYDCKLNSSHAFTRRFTRADFESWQVSSGQRDEPSSSPATPRPAKAPVKRKRAAGKRGPS